MDDTTLETLEYPAVLREIASFTVTSPGREKVEGLRPSGDAGGIEEAFKEFLEVREISEVSGKLPLGGVTDIREILGKADLGAFLLPEELLAIRNNLEAVLQLKAILNPSFSRKYPKISSKIEALSDLKPVYCELERILDEKGGIKDTASHGLYSIRKEIRSSKERARSILEDICKDKKYKEFLQEDFITIRDDRYVLSVMAGKHTNISGIIHGRSGSGATYFIEPMQLVELNNRVAILKKEEKSEEIEILKAATRLIIPEKEVLSRDLAAIGELDLVQAKALFAKKTKAIAPVIKAGGAVNFKGARHPLLILKELKGGDKVIPIDVSIPEGRKVLVISGANTGGKTVALKTLGLLAIMALSAIPVPVDEGSEAVIFNSIFSDIGDRQDIIASLSTFSAHVKRIREFLASAGPDSLVLIDELGAGTDPSEGSALALAVIERFKEIGAVTVITTHSNVIKAHAQVDPDYVNASVEFDEKTLRPLYRLRYGVPGLSLGLSIAQSLGMPSELIEKARAHLREKEAVFIESVRSLEEEREEIRKIKERLLVLEGRRDKAIERLRGEREELFKKARGKVESIIREAEGEIRETVNRVREERLKASPYRASVKVEEIGGKALSSLKGEPRRYVPSAGDRVMISGSNTKGVVLKIDEEGKKAEIMVGNLKVWVAWGKLNKRVGEDKKSAQVLTIDAGLQATHSINIIGMRVQEAIPLVTKFLDNAHAGGLNRVEIIHGIGTGKLAKGIEEYLGANPLVKGFRYGEQAQGGAGVTVVDLA